MCLYCNERSRHFQNLASVQRHMADKQHCRLAYWLLLKYKLVH